MKHTIWTLIILFASCLPVRVVDVGKLSPAASGRNYKTYNFAGVELQTQPFGNYQKNLQFLTVAIDREMKAKGFQRGVVNPDLLINLGLAVKEEVQTREPRIGEVGTWKYSAAGPNGRSYSWSNEAVEVARYHEGHLVLDFVDREKNELIWQGSVAGTLVKDDKKMEARINKVMESLFKKFPLKAN